jgi:hypothetical protein
MFEIAGGIILAVLFFMFLGEILAIAYVLAILAAFWAAFYYLGSEILGIMMLVGLGSAAVLSLWLTRAERARERAKRAEVNRLFRS